MANFSNLSMLINSNRQQNIKLQLGWALNKLLFNILAWNILIRLFLFLNYLIDPNISTEGSKVFQLLYQNGWALTILSSLLAFSIWLFEDLIFFKYLSRKNLTVYFLWRIILAIILLILTFLLVYFYYYQSRIITDVSEYFLLMKSFFINRTALYLFLIGIIVSTFINFFKTILQKVGYENFFPMISGYYRSPKEEDRIFIFIDLISSTKYAELLGHRKYSAFLQECFKQLGILEIKYRAGLYQFVGDEVILSWSVKKERNFRYAVKFFYEFQSILNDRSDYFLKEFGQKPEFTASINSGKVMVSEVGMLKSEIAFHGDVLNTASRIQKQCKSLNKQLLVTQSFVHEFEKVNKKFKTIWIAKSKLSGKQNPVDIYTIVPLE